MNVTVEGNVIIPHFFNSSSVVKSKVIMSTFEVPVSFVPLINSFKQFVINILNGPWKPLIEFEIPSFKGLSFENPRIEIQDGSILIAVKADVT